MIFVNLGGFWNPMKKQIKQMYKEGCINDSRIDFVAFVNKVEKVIPKANELAEKIEKLTK